MKNLLYILVLLSGFGFSQEKYICRDGTITFEASVPSFEPVKATSNTTTAVLNTTNGEFAALVLTKSFRFKLALMEEHFNENYMESDQFPKITFKGTLKNFKYTELSETHKEYKIDGILEVRKKQKEISTIVTLTKQEQDIILKTSFTTVPEDFDIKIPQVIAKKIAKTVIVDTEFILKK